MPVQRARVLQQQYTDRHMGQKLHTLTCIMPGIAQRKIDRDAVPTFKSTATVQWLPGSSKLPTWDQAAEGSLRRNMQQYCSNSAMISSWATSCLPGARQHRIHRDPLSTCKSAATRAQQRLQAVQKLPTWHRAAQDIEGCRFSMQEGCGKGPARLPIKPTDAHLA